MPLSSSALGSPLIISASFVKRDFQFLKPSGTSRGILTSKPSYFITLVAKLGRKGVGECSIIPKLSPESLEADFDFIVHQTCLEVEQKQAVDLESIPFPALRMAFEMALLNIQAQSPNIFFDSDFTAKSKPIPINGLVWMEQIPAMLEQALQKVQDGYDVIKFKVGALDHHDEATLIQEFRAQVGPTITIRLDANGAYTPSEALGKLEDFAPFGIHSIEQPIKPKKWVEFQQLCIHSPIPIALDEELIGILSTEAKRDILEAIRPQYIILKPSLIGGFQQADEWIAQCQEYQIGWWATSALESNLGLAAIAQWVASYPDLSLPQGLGTGGLFAENIPMPLQIRKGQLYWQP